MDISASQCSSSGCESGWTLYLDQSSQYQGFGGFVDNNNVRFEDDEEEDLSMVSDASSGPPHYCEDDEEYCFHHQLASKKNKNKKKNKEFCGSRNQHQYSYLDDTASSPVLSKKIGLNNEASMEFSQGFSATHYKGKSSIKKHFGFFQSSMAEKSASKEPGGYQGREWK